MFPAYTALVEGAKILNPHLKMLLVCHFFFSLDSHFKEICFFLSTCLPSHYNFTLWYWSSLWSFCSLRRSLCNMFTCLSHSMFTCLSRTLHVSKTTCTSLISSASFFLNSWHILSDVLYKLSECLAEPFLTINILFTRDFHERISSNFLFFLFLNNENCICAGNCHYIFLVVLHSLHQLDFITFVGRLMFTMLMKVTTS